MRVDQLERYERPACAICGVMAPEVQLPVGDGCKPACWLCAHDATEHADGSPCTCAPTEIYPSDIIARRMPLMQPREPRRFNVVSIDPGVDRGSSVQRFEEVAPGVLHAMGLTRKASKVERISRTFRVKNRVVTK